MNLWIRSQNKIELTKVNDIQIYKASDGFQIINYSENNCVIILGLYKTKERALEVLDEIENKFLLDIENSNYKCADLIIKAYMLPKIYEMPKE